jgi:Immunity protein Imm1
MRVRYVNTHDKSDPMNGAFITESSSLAELLDQRRKCVPFIAELVGENGYELAIGIGSSVGSAQYSRTDGEPPYMMAVSSHRHMKKGYVEFFFHIEPTPVAARYILSFDQVKAVSLHFLETGDKSNAVSWREFEPGAARGDVRGVANR